MKVEIARAVWMSWPFLSSYKLSGWITTTYGAAAHSPARLFLSRLISRLVKSCFNESVVIPDADDGGPSGAVDEKSSSKDDFKHFEKRNPRPPYCRLLFGLLAGAHFAPRLLSSSLMNKKRKKPLTQLFFFFYILWKAYYYLFLVFFYCAYPCARAV